MLDTNSRPLDPRPTMGVLEVILKNLTVLLLLSVALVIGVGACCSPPEREPLAFEEARERMLSAGREAREQGDPEKMVDGETARSAVEQHRARSQPKSEKKESSNLLETMGSSGG